MLSLLVLLLLLLLGSFCQWSCSWCLVPDGLGPRTPSKPRRSDGGRMMEMWRGESGRHTYEAENDYYSTPSKWRLKANQDMYGDPILGYPDSAKKCRWLDDILKCRKSQICKHIIQRYNCTRCFGKGICEHGRQHSKCKDCGGKGICEHGRQRYHCKDCKWLLQSRETNTKAGVISYGTDEDTT